MLFCAVDIGGRMETFSSYLKKKYPQHTFKTFSKYQLNKEHYDSNYDFQFNYHKRSKVEQYIISLLFFIYTLFRFDVIYIISGENILTRRLLAFELMTYKFFGKKVIMNFVGADIRNPDHTRMVSLKMNVVPESITEEPIQKPFQLKLCRLAEEYADEILVVSPDLFQFFTKEVELVPVFIDISKFQNELEAYRGQKKDTSFQPVILHAPSNPELKGTPYIQKVFNKLREQKQWELILTTDPQFRSQIHPPYTVTKYELLRLFSISDIVIDQLSIGWYGMQSIEALLSSSRVICLIDKKLENYLPPEHSLSVIHQPQDLEQTINEVVEELNDENILDTSWIKDFHTIERNSNIQSIFKRYLG